MISKINMNYSHGILDEVQLKTCNRRDINGSYYLIERHKIQLAARPLPGLRGRYIEKV